MKFCILFNLSPCARYCLLIGSQLTTWSQGNLHYIRLHFFQLDREFFCLLPSLARLYSAAASPSERLRSDGSLAIINRCEKYPYSLLWRNFFCIIVLNKNLKELWVYMYVGISSVKLIMPIIAIISSKKGNSGLANTCEIL